MRMDTSRLMCISGEMYMYMQRVESHACDQDMECIAPVHECILLAFVSLDGESAESLYHSLIQAVAPSIFRVTLPNAWTCHGPPKICRFRCSCCM